jgi:hypothetical protein
MQSRLKKDKDININWRLLKGDSQPEVRKSKEKGEYH